MDAMIYIGRFQPFHNGHLAVLKQALGRASRVVVVLGSAEQARNSKNPFTAAEREQMIRAALAEALPEAAERLVFCGVRDYYDDARWAAAVRACVAQALPGAARVGLIGYYKDASSYYLGLFPDWALVEAENATGLSSTDIRNVWLARDNAEGNTLLLESAVPGPVLGFLQAFRALAAYRELQDEAAAMAHYKALWAGSPFPPVFVTVDAVVRCCDSVLLIRRGHQPGKGLWALPGGFIEPRERLFDGALRELREETGLDMLPAYLKRYLRDKEVFDHPERSPRGRSITHAFFFDLELSEPPAAKAADDAAEARWVPLAELDGMTAQLFEDHAVILERFGLVRL